MSEDQEPTVEQFIDEQTPPESGVSDSQAEETAEQTTEQPENKPKGWDRVDFENDDRQVIEQRFHRLYGQVKQNDEINRQLIADNKKLMERFSKLEQAERDKETNSRFEAIRKGIEEATEVGDGSKVAALTDELVELRTKKPEPEPEPVDEPAMDQATFQTLSAWSTERGADGQPKRPWLREPATAHKVAAATQQVLTDPRFSHLNMLEKLNLLDQQFAPKRQQVLSSGDRPAKETGKTLTPAQKTVAHRMFPEETKAQAEKLYAGSL